ncbi:McrC family protein [Mycolicibacterium sp. GCM10028919]|uniref:McrC family protein n=1 Tax=Mycolicibacterium sp. GCM10028919 TaxID=3273401 RepID=UPI00361F03B2
MRSLHLTESKIETVELSQEEAASLRQIGQALASQASWWGQALDDDEHDEARTVVQCNQLSEMSYRVRISDAIGVIGLKDTQIVVRPKIPLPHVLHLFAESNLLPRSSLKRTNLGAETNFFSVIAAWFIEACEDLLRHGLASDYVRVTGILSCARGKIHPLATARAVMSGRPEIKCDYDTRSEDISLNRVLRAAVLRLLGSPALPSALRARCRRIQFRFSDVGDLQSSDLRARPEAVTRSYTDAHPLALLILTGASIAMQEDERRTWTFLFRTPEAIETGVRSCLSHRVGVAVAKRGRELAGDRKRRLNPDLVFGSGFAVGDVKYKLTIDGSIRRSDLNQVTTFATGYNANHAVVVGFGPSATGEQVQVGDVDVRGFNWDVNETNPVDAADRLAESLVEWLAVAAPVH